MTFRKLLLPATAALALAFPVAALADQHEQEAGAKSEAMSGEQSGQSLEEMALSSPEKFLGRTIDGLDGEPLGEIDKIVRRKDDDKLYFVLDSDGYLQPVLPESALALEDLDIRGDDLILTSQDAETHLTREVYQEENFNELAD